MQQIDFEREFTKWDQGFNDWRNTYADHPDRAAFLQYEKRFLDVRDKLVERRAELKMKYKSNNINSSFNNDLCQASAAAESILAQFEDNFPGPPSFGGGISRPNFNMMGGGRPLPPVNPILNYTHRKGQPPPSAMRQMMNQGGGGGPMMNRMNNPRMNPVNPPHMNNRPNNNNNMMMKNQRPAGAPVNMQKQVANNVRANAMNPNQQQQANQIVTLGSISISQEAYNLAKTQDLPAKLTTSQVKRFKMLRTKEEGKLNEDEKTYIERYLFISRKRNQYLYDEREKKRREDAGEEEVGEQPAPPGAATYDPCLMDFTSDDVPMEGN